MFWSRHLNSSTCTYAWFVWYLLSSATASQLLLAGSSILGRLCSGYSSFTSVPSAGDRVPSSFFSSVFASWCPSQSVHSSMAPITTPRPQSEPFADVGRCVSDANNRRVVLHTRSW
ncbi:hypothetical protein PR003_g22954 [Phytophthora rubi]|uniref:Secreted protein n=1 Tax=Phytophthora rubi TaxID=129364 RepID=A0A6A3LQ94_9STRA|nr:hypothetical protein PR002_g13471 [Phytophthora rubi]KAE9021472.1 hypothetical protein PR001_g13360 [Phytophthora rubi]KAE9299604.1 hypothetical protein PR003_g22954 [Phytophthora rubi]